MKIIGEKINGTRKRVARAIAERDAAYICDLASKQTAAGAAWLDVNAGTHPNQEPDDLIWLIRTVKHTPMINSISGEPERLNGILPIAAAHGCQVIALAMDAKKIPDSADQRCEVIRKVMATTRAAGLLDAQVYVDPLAMTLSTNTQSAQIALETMRRVRQEYPAVHLTIGLSNISFGLPARSFINRFFLGLAIQAGLDSAILDPLDREIQAAILTTELLLGQDPHCLNFIRASRKGIFEGSAA
jgi:cobalamin-dependent methionine synthase I